MTAKEALYKLSGLARDKYPNSSVEPLCLTIETALNRLEELEQIAIKGFNPNTDEYEYGQLFYSKENGYELKNKNGDLLTNVMIQKANDDYFKMKNVLKIIKEKKVAIGILFIGDNAYVYNELYDAIIVPSKATPKYEYKLTKTEFDLLKEYLK